jgi:hemerythrin superfamily protein
MSAVVQQISPSITTMIRMDHTHVLAVFHRYRVDSPPAKKHALVRNACLALQVHAQLEEEIFYPALRAVMNADAVLDKSEPEHNQMRSLIGELRALTSARGLEGAHYDDKFDDKFFELMRLVIHHVADEETTLLPAAERLLRERLGRLGIEMTKRRLELLKPHAAEIAETTARSFPAAAAAGAALLTLGVIALGTKLFSSARTSYRHRY